MMNGERSEEGWLNITEEFKEACSQLEVGQLLHDKNIGLFEAMSAFEMMDPKMDSGIIGTPIGQPTKAAADLKTKDFSNAEMISIIDGTLRCMVSWLEGGSMAQTIFANLYLHNPTLIEDRVLKAFSIGVLKLVAISKDIITTACVYEDEHFQPSTHGFQLADSVSEQRIGGMLKEAEDELAKKMRNLKSKLHNNASEQSDQAAERQDLVDLEGVLTRFRIVKLLVSTILSLKYSGTPVGEEVIDKGLDKLMDSIDNVIKAVADQPAIDPLELPMFDIAATSRLLPPSFPRTVQLMSMSETLNFLSTMCSRLQTVNKMPKKIGLVDAMDFFDNFSYEQPTILIRSLILYHYMPLGTGKVFNKHKLTDLIADELRAFNSPPLFSPAYKNTLMSHEHVKLVLGAFLSSAAHVLDNLFAAKCNTRARQRERLAVLLEELGVLQSEAERVDSLVDAVGKEKLGDKALGQQASSIGTWVLFLTTKTMVKYLTLGMELELYDIREYCYFFWYMSEVILLWNTSSLFRAEKSLTDSSLLESKATSGKKKHKQKKPTKTANIHQELMAARCKQHISGGLYRLLLALKSANLLPTTGDYTYDNEEVRYTHRFAPFACVNFPHLMHYQSYVDAVGLNNDTPPFIIIDFLRQSFRNFETARSILESDVLKANPETAALMVVAKNNMVVTKILADSLQKDISRLVKFDFSSHKIFPMVKFV